MQSQHFKQAMNDFKDKVKVCNSVAILINRVLSTCVVFLLHFYHLHFISCHISINWPTVLTFHKSICKLPTKHRQKNTSRSHPSSSIIDIMSKCVVADAPSLMHNKPFSGCGWCSEACISSWCNLSTLLWLRSGTKSTWQVQQCLVPNGMQTATSTPLSALFKHWNLQGHLVVARTIL